MPILSRPVLPFGSKVPDHCLRACPTSLQAFLSLGAQSRPEPSPATSFLCSALLLLPYLFPTVFPWQLTQLPQLWKPASRGRGQLEEALRKGRPCQVREWKREFSWDRGLSVRVDQALFPYFLPLLGLCPTKKGKRQLRADRGVWGKATSSAGPVPGIHPAARDSPPLGKSHFFFFKENKN